MPACLVRHCLRRTTLRSNRLKVSPCGQSAPPHLPCVSCLASCVLVPCRLRCSAQIAGYVREEFSYRDTKPATQQAAKKTTRQCAVSSPAGAPQPGSAYLCALPPLFFSSATSCGDHSVRQQKHKLNGVRPFRERPGEAARVESETTMAVIASRHDNDSGAGMKLTQSWIQTLLYRVARPGMVWPGLARLDSLLVSV